MRSVPRLCEFNPGIFLTTKEKHGKTSVRVVKESGALCVHPLWFYKHQHDNRVHSKLFVACQRWWFQWRFWFVPSVPGYFREEEEYKPDPWRNPIERNHMGLNVENEVAKRVASDHHRPHARSIAAVNDGLKILWRVGGNGEVLHPFAIWNQHFENFLIIGANTGCPRRNGQNFGRVFLMLNYTDITQNTYVQSWTVTEIMAWEVWNFDSCYSLIDYQIHIETGRNMWFL